MSDQVTKSEADGSHTCSHYLVCEDEQKPSTWHLRVKDRDGNPDHHLMGGAWAALHSGYRGNKYEGPGKDEALKKLKSLYESEKMDVPVEASAATAEARGRLEAALAEDGISLENLRSSICQAAQNVSTLITPSGSAATVATMPNAIWVQDIMAPTEELGETWEAIVQAANGKTYCINFTVEDGAAKISGDPREVVRQVDYVPAPAEASKAIHAGDVPDHEFHGNQWTEEGATAIEKSKEADAKSAKAFKSNKFEDHREAMLAHNAAATAHHNAATASRHIGDQATARTQEAIAKEHENASSRHFKIAKASAEASSISTIAELEADQPRKMDGKFHGAEAASREADAATQTAKTKAEHTTAAALHKTAQQLHTEAGDVAKAEGHRVKSKAHEDCANAMSAAAPASVPTRSALEASFDVPAPKKFDAFMVMPAGIRTVTLTRLGRPHEVTVNVNRAGAIARQAQLDAVNAACKLKAYNCFDHERKRASSHPIKYWWEDGKTAGRPAGIYQSAEPTASGLEAVQGKDYQGWSETFFVDNEFAGPDKPALIINPLENPLEADGERKDPNDYRVMGTLTNNPAFKDNEPLFASKPGQNNSPPAPSLGLATAARNAGARISSQTKLNTTMRDTALDAAALQARINQLEQDIASLEAKDDAISKADLRASRSELEARHADLKLAKQEEKLVAMEAAETKRKEEAADAAVAVGIEAQAIPMLDKKLQAEWRSKFIADPTLIPLMAEGWRSKRATNGRVTQGAGSTALMGFGDVTEGPVRILRALSASLNKQRQFRSALDGDTNKKRTMLAKEAAIIWEKEIRGYELDAEGQRRPTIKPEFLLCPLNAALDAATDDQSLGTLAGTFVSQRFLDIFMYKLPLISNGKIMTDFSDQPSDLKQTVSTRKVVVPAVVSYDPTLAADGYPNGWQPANAPQTVDVNITMDELIGVPIQFDLATLSETQRQLFMEQAPAAAYANALYFLKKIYAVCTAANFNSYANVTAADANGIVKVPTAYATYVSALVDFARSRLAEVAAAFDANEVPDEDRSVLLNAAYYNKATTDPSLVTFFAGQQSPEIVTQGRLPDLAGFVPIKAPNFPGTNNRFGMFLQKNGLLAKSRLPQNLNTINPGAGNGSVTQIVHPDTGLAMMLIQFVDHRRGISAWLPAVILGAAAGDPRGGLVGTTQ